MRDLPIPAEDRRCLDRIRSLPINAADRANAIVEFERARKSTDALMSIVQRYRHFLVTLHRTFNARRARHG